MSDNEDYLDQLLKSVSSDMESGKNQNIVSAPVLSNQENNKTEVYISGEEDRNPEIHKNTLPIEDPMLGGEEPESSLPMEDPMLDGEEPESSLPMEDPMIGGEEPESSLPMEDPMIGGEEPESSLPMEDPMIGGEEPESSLPMEDPMLGGEEPESSLPMEDPMIGGEEPESSLPMEDPMIGGEEPESSLPMEDPMIGGEEPESSLPMEGPMLGGEEEEASEQPEQPEELLSMEDLMFDGEETEASEALESSGNLFQMEDLLFDEDSVDPSGLEMGGFQQQGLSGQEEMEEYIPGMQEYIPELEEGNRGEQEHSEPEETPEYDQGLNEDIMDPPEEEMEEYIPGMEEVPSNEELDQVLDEDVEQALHGPATLLEEPGELDAPHEMGAEELDEITQFLHLATGDELYETDKKFESESGKSDKDTSENAADDKKGSSGKKKGKRRKGKKGKKGADEAASEELSELEEEGKEEKKRGFLQLLAAWFGEDDEEAQVSQENSGMEEMNGISGENLDVLKELNKEDLKAKKQKELKQKKEKEKQEKQEKKQKKDQEKKRKQQEAKEKKAEKKAEQENQVPSRPEKKIPFRRILGVALFASSILALLLIFALVVPNQLVFADAEAKLEEKDYKAVYNILSGRKLYGDNELIYKKALVIMELQRKYDSYETYKQYGDEIMAINELMQGVTRYNNSLARAGELGVESELSTIYQQIMASLNSDYGLSEEDVQQILEYDKITYTKKLDSIINGTKFADPNAPAEVEEPVLEDILPEEEAMLNALKGDGMSDEISVSGNEAEMLQENSTVEAETEGSDIPSPETETAAE